MGIVAAIAERFEMRKFQRLVLVASDNLSEASHSRSSRQRQAPAAPGIRSRRQHSRGHAGDCRSRPRTSSSNRCRL